MVSIKRSRWMTEGAVTLQRGTVLFAVAAAVGVAAIAASTLGPATASSSNHILRVKASSKAVSLTYVAGTTSDGRTLDGMCVPIADMAVSKGWLVTGKRVANGTPLALLVSTSACDSADVSTGNAANVTVPEDSKSELWLDLSKGSIVDTKPADTPADTPASPAPEQSTPAPVMTLQLNQVPAKSPLNLAPGIVKPASDKIEVHPRTVDTKSPADPAADGVAVVPLAPGTPTK